MSNLSAKFRVFTSMTYPQQAQAFLNAYWKDHQNSAEDCWKWAHQFGELDVDKKMTGSDLDEFNAHRFLEKNGSTKRVVELREDLRAIDMDFNKRMALIEFLLFNFKHKVEDFVERPQGDNTKEIEKAQALLDEVQRQLDAALASAAISKRKAEEAKRTADIARHEAEVSAAKAAEAKAKADEAAAAEAEQKSALAEVQAQEDARNARTKELEAKGEDMNLGVVARNRAKNELAQHLSEDPLPLRKAKITLEAATKRAEKARKLADDAHAIADAAAQQAAASQREAEAAAEAAEEAARQAEADVVSCENKAAEAQAYLEEVKATAGSSQGNLWWMERELEEKKKYMPRRLQK